MLFSIQGTISFKGGIVKPFIYEIWAGNEEEALSFLDVIFMDMDNASGISVGNVECNDKTVMPDYYIIRERDNNQGYDILHKRMNNEVNIMQAWCISNVYETRDDALHFLYALINKCLTELIPSNKHYVAYCLTN